MDNSIAQEFLSQLLLYKSGDVVDCMFKRGIDYKLNYGVPATTIKELASPFFGDHELAEDLFAMDYREAKLAAIFIEDPATITEEQMERWATDFTNDEIVEQACTVLFCKSSFAASKAAEWAKSSNDFLQKAGLTIFGKLAAAASSDETIFATALDAINKITGNEQTHARAAAAFALREIGKKSKALNAKAIAMAKEMSLSQNFTSKWIAEESLWILEDESLQKRLT